MEVKPFGLSKAQLRSFHEPVLEYLPGFFDPEGVSDSEYEDLESLAQLAVESVVAERIEKLGVSLPPDQMTERLLFNDGQRAVVSGLRFRNLDLRFPFVALKANFRLNEPETARVLKTMVMKTYGEADPRGFTFLEQPGLDLGQTENWNVTVAGMTDTKVIEVPSRLQLTWETAIETFHPTLEREYKDWATNHPSLGQFVRLESFQDLDASASKGLFLSVYDDHGWGGFIAGTRAPLFGREALYIIDLFLTKRLRGRGLAKVLQSQFLLKLKSDFDIVCGHIHRTNESSLKTALSLGRVPIQQEYFFSLSAD